MMHIEVQDDRILIGSPDFVPRFLDLPRVKQVRAGETFELEPDSTWDYLEVSGTLRASRGHDTTLRVTHLFVLPGGRLDFGTAEDPLLTADLRIIFRDVPVNASRDPFQWGNGLLNFGQQSRVGASKTPRVIIEDASAGATSLTLAAAVTGWRVGDELLAPDPVAPGLNGRPRREARLAIMSLNGNVVGLSRPLDFAHVTQKAPDGRVALRPIVVNVTRNIVLRSENPFGTAGHTANVGNACWDIQANQFEGLGRTTVEPLDEIANHVGRYTDHDHHVGHDEDHHDLPCRSMGNVYHGIGAGKWGKVVHGTHDTEIRDNIAYDFPGAGFVTEDGYEVRNRYVGNTALYILRSPTHSGLTFVNVNAKQPGTEGTGFWFRGIMQAIEGNQTWNSHIGLNLFNQQGVAGMFPSQPGGPLDVSFDPDRPFDDTHTAPLSNADNVWAANIEIGMDLWAVKRHPIDRMVAVGNHIGGFSQLSNGDQFPWYRDPLVVGFHKSSPADADLDSLYYGPQGLRSIGAYVRQFDLEGGYIGGCARGLSGGLGVNYAHLSNVTLQNVVNIQFTEAHLPALPADVTMTDVRHVPFETQPHRYIILSEGIVWSGTGPLPVDGLSRWITQRGSPIVVKNWQETGKDYRLYQPQQLASTAAWPSDIGNDTFNCPEAGLTMGQCWDTYGMAAWGGILPDAEKVTLDGLVNGFGREGLDLAMPPPRGIVTFPTPRAPAEIIDQSFIWFYALVTGDPNQASLVCRISIDGGPMRDITDRWRGDTEGDTRRFTSTAIAPGRHTVRTWRTDMQGQSLPASEMAFSYIVGAVSPPIDPPPPTTTTVPNMIGLTQSAATAALLAAKLKVGTVSTSTDALPAGQVFRQIPDAGLMAAINSVVDLDISSGPPPLPPNSIPVGTYALTDSAGHTITVTVR